MFRVLSLAVHCVTTAVCLRRAAVAFFISVLVVVQGASAAEPDYSEAARLYDAGRVAAAAEIFERLAEEGHAVAQVSLASLHASGELTGQRDFEAAARWYRRAAEQGDAVAQMNLGDLYARGLGVERDLEEAWVLLSRAAEQGRDWAEARRRALEAEMAVEQIESARERLAKGKVR